MEDFDELNKDELYVGMRVEVLAGFHIERFEGEPGTIIELTDKSGNFDCLVEFDSDVGGHDGLHWGDVEGKKGHCYWFMANEVVAIKDESDNIVSSIESLSIRYNELFSYSQ